jgi:hypothetical protein
MEIENLKHANGFHFYDIMVDFICTVMLIFDHHFYHLNIKRLKNKINSRTCTNIPVKHIITYIKHS